MSLVNSSYLRICLLLHIYQAAAVESFDRPLHSSLHSRKMHLPFAVRINHTQNYDARLMANKSGANSRKHWRHRRLSCCEICMQNAKGVPTNQLSLVQLNSCSWSCSFSFSFCIILSVPVFSFIRHIPSCHLLSSISSGFTVTISVSVTGNLLGCPTMRWSGCLAVWQSDNLTVLAAWLLGFRAAQAASLCASCCLQLAASSAHKSPLK